jgi:glucose-1-phosphate cytidylyltransferase
MKAVLLAGGLGTRISEETTIRPKPMVEVGGAPILWHIMKIYAHHGINEFVVCCGYKGNVIKEWFSSYFLRTSDVTFDLANNQVEYHQPRAEPWKVTLVDTGEQTMTGGRLRRVRELVGDSTFCMTYGDGVSDIDIGASIDFHRREGRKATMAVVQPPGRFGAVVLREGQTEVSAFSEKPVGDGAWINGGFFVLEPSVLGKIAGDSTVWEQEPLRGLSDEGQLSAFRHTGFWQPMDTLRDRQLLESMWESGTAPWKKW